MPAPPPNSKPGTLDLGRKTIRTQLALLMLAVVLPAFLIAIVFLSSHRDEAREVARDKVKILVDNAADRVVASLRMHEVLLSLLAAQPQVRSMNSKDCDSLFQHYARLHPEYLNLSTRDMDGNLVCAYRDSPASPEQTFSYPWFQQTVRSGKFNASNVFLDPATQHWVTVLTMPVFDEQQRPNGVVVLPLDLQKLNEVLLGVVPDDAVVTVTDRQSDILLRS
ncbi:MAG: PDC sensor domain-containing protein, partial [Burkholderiaceae bacterium]